MGHINNSLRHHGMIATSSSWRRFWLKHPLLAHQSKKTAPTIAPERAQSARCTPDHSEKTAGAEAPAVQRINP